MWDRRRAPTFAAPPTFWPHPSASNEHDPIACYPLVSCLLFLIAALFAVSGREATAQISITPPADTGMQISWEVRNRFRLFREERDFKLQVEALSGRSILASEQLLATQSDGRGWARNTLGRAFASIRPDGSTSHARAMA